MFIVYKKVLIRLSSAHDKMVGKTSDTFIFLSSVISENYITNDLFFFLIIIAKGCRHLLSGLFKTHFPYSHI